MRGIEYNNKGKEGMGFWCPGVGLKMEATWLGEGGGWGNRFKKIKVLLETN